MNLAATSASVPNRPFGLDRLVSADAEAALERLQGSPLVAEGRAVMVGLDAIKLRLAERWPSKRQQVWDHLERSFVRQIGNAGMVVRVSETDYLVAQPGAARFAAQASCLTVLREVLTFFLGEAGPGDIALREVTAVTPQGVQCQPLEAQAIMLAAAAQRTAPAPAIDTPEIAPDDASPDRWSPFSTGDGRTLRVSCRIDPVFELSAVRLVGHRLEPRVIDLKNNHALDAAGIRALSPGDRERVDLATIARGVNRLRASDKNSRRPLLMLPAAFTTFGSTRGRTALTQALREARVDEETRIVVEIRELDGAPLARLSEAVGLMRPFCYAVVGRVTSDRRAIDAAIKGGVSGLSLELNKREDSEQELLFRLHSFANRAKSHVRVCMAFGLTTPRHLALARLAGLTHASITTEDATEGIDLTT